MGFTDQGIPISISLAALRQGLPDGDLAVERATPPPVENRVNWLFSGVLLGAASWMLVLGIVFAAIGNWVIAGALFGGIVLCGLAIWRAGHRASRSRGTGNGPGRHRANGGSVAD